MSIMEELINELLEDCCEIKYKDRDALQKIKLLENMINETEELKIILKEELNSIVS